MRPSRLAALVSAVVLVVVGSGALVLHQTGGDAAAAPPNGERVLVLGFDGAASQITERLLAEGRLPNLAALRERGGGYAPLRTANPAQSPVSWASLTTGVNPGETGIYDFLRRRFVPGDPAPQIAIGLAEPVSRALLSPLERAVIVFVAGSVGAVIGGLLAFVVLARFNRGWRKGGRLQSALCAPAMVLALVALVVVGWLPERVTHARNLRGGEPFWTTIDRAGLVCEAIEAPLAFPADEMEHGSCLAGLGVPDLQGTWGSWAMWSDDPRIPAETETAGSGYFVRPAPGAAFDVVLAGPLDPRPDVEHLRAVDRSADEEKYKRELAFDWTAAERRESETREALLRMERRLRTRLTVELRQGAGATVTTTEGEAFELVPDEWSAPLPVAFAISPLARFSERGRIPGRVRLLLTFPEDAGPRTGTFRLFVAPVNIDPGATLPPNLAIASPPEYARTLAEAAGPFETLGWPELTNPVKDGMLEDVFFLAHLRAVMAGREKRLMARLEAGGWDCLFAMFCETDRVQHVMWRHTDPASPTYDAAAAARFGGAIDAFYVEMDRIVGRAVDAVGPDTHVIVISDHGFAPFRRGVALNNFLRAQGLQVARPGAVAGPQSVGALTSGSQFFADVDWARTRAYAMGLGNIYLNLAGREPGGIVAPADAPALLVEIRDALLALRDDDGTQVVREVYLGTDLYSGSRADEAPDLVVGFEHGYRVSWQTCLGACDDDVIIDNTQQWSADHCSVDPSLVPGILFTSFGLPDALDPGILDVKPTILDLLGIPSGPSEGASFAPQRGE